MLLRQTGVFAALLALTAAAVPLGTFAQPAPPAPPSYARPSYGGTDETIQGRISSFDGAYALQVRDDRGFIDNVQLRPGTVINPTGIRLAPGMAVTIHGVNRGATFAANEIDTPYQTYDAVPIYPYGPFTYPAYPYPDSIYAYPYYGFGLGFGPGFGRDFGRAFGRDFRGGFHGGSHRGR